MTSAHFRIILTIILFQSTLSHLMTTFHSDSDRRNLLTKQRTWSPWIASDYPRSIGDGSDISSTFGGRPTTFEASSTVTDLTVLKQEKPALRKCCSFGEELTQRGCVRREKVPPFLPVVYHNVTFPIDTPVQDLFTLVFGDNCLHGRYRLDPSSEAEDEFYLLDNGSLLQPAISTVFSGVEDFCMEGFFKDEDSHTDEDSIVLPLVCFPPPSDDETDKELSCILYPVGLLISVPFLIIILVAHIFIPSLHRTLNGKCLISHISFLIVAYVGLATIQLSRSLLPDELCKTIAFIVQFAFIACFSWLTAMCFSIWRIISNMSASFFAAENKQGTSRNKVFLKYSVFALAIPVIIISVSLVMDLTPSIPASFLKPQFGIGSCWFLTDTAALPYFYGPMTVLIMGNAVLFVLTARKIIQKNREEACYRPSNSNMAIIRYENKALKICFTLFILMGVNWTMEIISWAAGNKGGMILKSVWYFTDMCNSLQGLFIFIMFILDSEFRLLVKQKLSSCGCCKSGALDASEVDSKTQNQFFTVTSLLLSELNHQDEIQM